MQKFIADNGEVYPVSDETLIYPEDWEARESDVLTRWKANARLTPDERLHLTAWTNRRNLNRALDVLDGKSLEDYFGPGATLDQVHGVTWHPDTCTGHFDGAGCAIELVYDHFKRDQPDCEFHAHRVHQTCEAHAHLGGDCCALHEQVTNECREKEEVICALCEDHGLPDRDKIKWRFDAARNLEIDVSEHPTLKHRHVREMVQRRFTGRKVLVR